MAAYDGATGKLRWQKVEGRSSRLARDTLKLTLERAGTRDPAPSALGGPKSAPVVRLASETVTVTANHPYLLSDGTWRNAGDLKLGDQIKSATDAVLVVARIARDETPSRVYNFEVANDHTYAVGADGAWVHSGPAFYDLFKRMPGKKLVEAWERYHKKKWPAGEQACHIKALADGGTNHPSNIKPMTRADHIAEHVRNGDFVRWGGR